MTPATNFPATTGEMSERIRAYPWCDTPLGAIGDWPISLRVTVGIMLNARFPMLLWWGKDSVQIYNDAYASSLGADRHPSAFARPARESWAEIWDTVGPQIAHVMSGNGATYHEDQLVPLTRDGVLEQIYWTYNFCPVEGAHGKVLGVLAISTDVTQRHFDNERADILSASLLKMFQAGPNFTAVLSGPEHTYQFVNDHYRALLGDRDFVGTPVRQAVPEVAGQGFFELLDKVFLTGVAFDGKSIPMRFRPSPDAPMTDVLIDLSYQPIVSPDGSIFGIYVDGRTSDCEDDARPQPDAEKALLEPGLSLREGEVLRWTAAGKTASEIAVILNISGRTVEFHINSAAQKLDTVNRVQTVVEAIRRNLIDL